MKIAVLGAGAWGTALALSQTARHDVVLWTRQAAHAEEMASRRANPRYLPGFDFPPVLQVEHRLDAALDGADFALSVVPTSGFRDMLRQVARLRPGLPVVWANKGFEPETSLLPHQVAAEELSECACGVLSGPSFAKEVAQGLPTALTLAAADADFALEVARALHGGALRVYTSRDVGGVEIGGAVKNVMAIAAGISDGLGFGYNARAALITRGLAEMARLGVALGGQMETFMGLTGMGDLILTCTGDLSRNRTVGLKLASGQSLDDILRDLGHVAEGVHTAREVRALAQRLRVDMPITQAVCGVLFDGIAPAAAVEALLAREQKAE